MVDSRELSIVKTAADRMMSVGAEQWVEVAMNDAKARGDMRMADTLNAVLLCGRDNYFNKLKNADGKE